MRGRRRKISLIILAGLLAALLAGGALNFRSADPVIFTENGTSVTEEAFLEKGTWLAHIRYRAEDYATFQVTAGDDPVSVIILPFNKGEQMLRLYIRGGGSPVRIVCADVSERTDLQVESLTLHYQRKLSVLYGALKAALFYLAAVCAVFGIVRFRRADRSGRLYGLCMAGIIAVSSLPLLLPYIPGGHDIVFHLYRIAGMAESWKQGAFPARMQALWWNGYGYPVGIFYGDVMLMFPAALYLLGMPLYQTYRLFVLAVNILTAFAAQYCFTGISGSRKTALSGTALYCLSMWRLTDLYIRTAVGEYCALLFVPFVLLGLERLFSEDGAVRGLPASGRNRDSFRMPEKPEAGSAVLPLTVGFSGLLLCHLISTLMLAVFAALVCLFHLKRLTAGRRIVPLLQAAGWSILLCLGFLVPFADSYLGHDLVIHHLSGMIQTYGMRWKQFISPFFDTMAGALPLADAGPEMPQTPGYGILFAFLISLWFLFRKDDAREKGPVQEWIPACLVVLAVWMSSCYFPFDWIQEHLPGLFFLIGSVEFPWRYLVIVTAFTLWLYMKACRRAPGRARLAAAALLVLVTVVQGTALMGQRIHENFLYLKPADAASVEVDSRDSMYLFQGQDWSVMNDRSVRAPEGAVVRELERKGTTFRLDVRNTSDSEQTVSLPVFDYRHYRAELTAAGKTVLSGENRTPGEEADTLLSGSAEHRLNAGIPAGFEGQLTVFYREPLLWRLSELISAAAAAALLTLLLRSRRYDRV